MLHIVRAGSVAVAGLAVVACATTTFQATWKQPGAAPLNFRGEKVLALIMNMDQGIRFAAEDALAREITAEGAVGVAAHTLIPDEMDQENGQEQARALLEKAGVVGVVSMRVVGSQQQITATPSSFWVGPPYSSFWGRPGWGRPGYWGWGWSQVHSPVVRTDTLVSVETLVFSLRQDQLVWTATSRTTNPSNVRNFIRELSGAAARALRREGLIQ